MQGWSELAPRFEWRPSQRHLLELCAHVRDERWHLSAPPGAGKTLIGLELARRLGRQTLVVSPTTAVRDQWRRSTAMFGADPDTFTSAEVGPAVPLTSVTYQLLGNPGQAAAELRAAARRLWLAELTAELGDEAATARAAATESADPERARRELRRHVRALRRSLTTGADVGVARESLLGERAVALVEKLAALGIGCVVLDECHHLLDWWALVVSALVERLGVDRDVAVVGLTATLPEPDSRREAQNYRGLLGEVDAELHLAAMVAEGAVAPWRDGVHLTTLTDTEAAFVEDWQARFIRDLDDHLTDEPFVDWAVAQLGQPALDARLAAGEPGDASGAGATVVVDERGEAMGTEDAGTIAATEPDAADLEFDRARWDAWFDRDPLAAMALSKWWQRRRLELPAGFEAPPGTGRARELEDRLLLVDAWLHDPHTDVPDDARAELAGVLRRYGATLTTGGVRWSRSVADLVCARSTAKGVAAAEVVAREAARRGDDLCALVVVERDRAATPPAAARAALGEDAGTAAQVLGALCTRGELVAAGVLAVTGSGAWADALAADRIVAALRLALDGTGQDVRAEGCGIPGAVRLVGEGGGWTPAAWLAAVGAALDDGAARVLLATRGLVGEGWDHPALNVLVDLSEAATRTAATQLRGRAIRLDPARPDKLASLWDVVVCHATAHGDWSRLQRRHDHWWGPDGKGAVVTGAGKLHWLVDRPAPPATEHIGRINAESEATVADVGATRRAWAAVDPGGVATSAVHLRPTRHRRTVRTRPAGWRWLGAAAAGSGLTGGAAAASAVAITPALWPAALLGVAGAATLGREARGRRRDEAATLAALGEAVLAGLVRLGHDDLAAGRLDVSIDRAGGRIATIVGVDDDAATVWADALAETLGPLGAPRWMVTVGDRAWRVPTVVGATREAAEVFATALRSRLPGARLVRAGTPRATELVLADAGRRPDQVIRSLRWS